MDNRSSVNVLAVCQSDVRSQDTLMCITGTTGTVEGREAAWQFVKDHWTELHQRYADDPFSRI